MLRLSQRSAIKMSITLFNAVPAGAIEVLTDANGAPHFKRADLGRFLEIVDVRHNFKNIAAKPRSGIRKPGGVGTPSRSGTHGGGENPHDAFVDLEGALEIVVRSRKPKAVELTKWLICKGVEKITQENRKVISEKDIQIALLDDDLTDAQQNVVILEHDNLELQAEVERLTTRAVPYLENPEKDNGMAIIQKNDGDSYPYLAVCGQRGYVAQKIQNKLVNYPNSQIVVLAETPNAIVHFNWLRERGCIIANPVRVRHFRLNENYTHQRLVELREA